jgi:hypothetical protein
VFTCRCSLPLVDSLAQDKDLPLDGTNRPKLAHQYGFVEPAILATGGAAGVETSHTPNDNQTAEAQTLVVEMPSEGGPLEVCDFESCSGVETNLM